MGDVTIDSLVITLGLDPAGLTKGQKEALESFGKTKNQAASDAKAIEASGKQAANFYTQIKKEALGLFAVVQGTNGLKDFVAQTVSGLAAIGRTAKVAGVNVKDLSAFQNIVKLNGGTADEAAASIKNLAAEMERFKITGQSAMLPAFAKIGANRNDTAIDVIHKFETWAQGKPAQLVNYEGQQLGLPDAEINEALKPPAEQAKDQAEAQRNAANADDAAKAAQLQRSFFELQQTINRLSRDTLIPLLPMLNGFLVNVTALSNAFPGLTQAVIAATTVLTIVGGLKFAAGGVRALAGGGGAAAAGGGGGGVLVPAAALIALGLSQASFAANDSEEHIQDYQAVQKNLKGATNDQLAGALGYLRFRFEQERSRGAPAHVFNTIAGQANAIKAELGARGVQFAHPAPAPSPAAGGQPTGGTATPGGSVAQKKAQAYQFFRANGYSDAAAKGIIAGISAEDPDWGTQTPNGQGSSAVGIGQWLKRRQKDFEATFHKPISKATFNDELRFIDWEMTHTEAAAGKAVKSGATPWDSAIAYIEKYMRPGGGVPGDERRARRELAANVTIGQVVVKSDGTDGQSQGRAVGKGINDTLSTQANRGLN